MTKQEFLNQSFEDAMQQAYQEIDDVTTIEELKTFIIEKVNNEDFYLAKHIIDNIYNDDNPDNTDWYLYDYSMGTLDYPSSVSKMEHIEHLLDD